MRMTRLEWRYLQKIALDHPYYDTHKLPLTESEAEAIIREQVTRTGKEFVDSIYSQLGMSRPEKQKNRFTWAANVVSLFRVPPIRKIVAVALALLLLTVFFAATPTGRAVAESVIQYIVQLLDDGKLVIYSNDNESVSSVVETGDVVGNDEKKDDDSSKVIFVGSFDDFWQETDKKPFVLPLQYTDLFYNYDVETGYLSLYSKYKTEDGDISACQIWNADEIVSSTLDNYMLYDSAKQIYYSFEKESGYFYFIRVFEDSVLNVATDGHYSLDSIADLLK